MTKTLKFTARNHPCEPERTHVYYMHVHDSLVMFPEMLVAYQKQALRRMQESLWSMTMQAGLPEVEILDPDNCTNNDDWRALSVGLEWGCKFD